MPSGFLHQLARDTELDDRSQAALAQAGVRSGEDLHSLAECFPSMVQAVPRLAELAGRQTSRLGPAYAAAHAARTHRRPLTLGAGSPPGAPYPVGSVVQPAAVLAAAGQPLAAQGAIDLRLPNWPVRVQGDRQTCVAFSVTACLEHALAAVCATARVVVAIPVLGHQDRGCGPASRRGQRAPGLRARRADDDGRLCGRAVAVQRRRSRPHLRQTAADPSAAARADAQARRRPVATFQSNPAGAAARLHALLKAGRPVAVTLAVFCDPTTPNGPSNWGGANGWCLGRVLGPPAHAVSAGGHCVCVTGFVQDPLEPLGGHFILRNSWGTEWAAQAPQSGETFAPERGYGEVSASYVDACCWELLQL